MPEEQPSAYSVKEVAGLLGLTVQQIRRFVAAGLLEPRRGPRGELHFSFQDLAFLRLVKRLSSERLAPRRIHRALRRLRAQLPAHEPLSGVRIAAERGQLIARQRGELWDPESGQRLFDFESEPEFEVRGLGDSRGEETPLEIHMSAEDWYRLGCELHEGEPEQARGAYQHALELEPELADARINLGCLHHLAGRFEEAEAAYRCVLHERPDDPVATFDLAVVLEDLARLDEAIAVYERALELDPECADAHYNLARLRDRLGEPAAAIRHLRDYRRLTE